MSFEEWCEQNPNAQKPIYEWESIEEDFYIKYKNGFVVLPLKTLIKLLEEYEK